MPNVPPLALAIAAAAVGVLIGALVAFVFARRWAQRAHASGRASRDGEVAVLTEQRDGATVRVASRVGIGPSEQKRTG